VAHLINRFAEAMTLFRRSLRRHFPADPHWPSVDGVLHVPVPSTMGSAAVPQPADLGRVCGFDLRHGSLLFWFVGLIPDLATLRDRSVQKPMKVIYGMLSMGWRGLASLARYQSAYRFSAGSQRPLFSPCTL